MTNPHVTFVGVRPPRDHRVSRVAWKLWLGGTFTALALYFTTASRGAQWQDSGWQQYRIVSGQLDHPRGLALSHPLQYYLGRLSLAISGQPPAFAITLVSVLAGAIAVGNVAAAGYLLSGSGRAAGLCALALMLSHTFWKYSCLTESYALVAALQSGKWLAMAWAGRTGRVWGLWLAALCNGLGVSNHMLAGLATPILAYLAVWLWRFGRLRTRDLAVGGLLWCVGTLPYSGLVLAELASTGDLLATARSATVGTFGEQVLNTSIGVRLLSLSFGCMLYNLPGLTFLWVVLARPRWALAPRAWIIALWCEAAMYFLFAVRYPIVDQYTFFVPTYVAAALLAPIGLAGVVRRAPSRIGRALWVATAVTAAWPPLIYVGTTEVLRRTGWLGGLVRNKPYRDGYGWFMLPWERWNRYADQLNQAIASNAGPDGLVLLEDHMQGYGVRYALAAGEIPADVTLIEAHPGAPNADKLKVYDAIFAAEAAAQPVVLVPYDRDAPRWKTVRGAWRRVGDIYVLSAGDVPGRD